MFEFEDVSIEFVEVPGMFHFHARECIFTSNIAIQETHKGSIS
jgi:hypothetical protein